MMMRTERTYAVSIISLVAANGLGVREVLSRRSLGDAVTLAQQYGWKLQLLPLRNSLFDTRAVLSGVQPSDVVSFEDRWGHPLYHAVVVELFQRGRLKNAVATLLLFMGNRANVRLLQQFRDRFPTAVEIDTGALGAAVEPDINKQPDWSYWSDLTAPIVVDTHHLQEFGLPLDQLLDWVSARIKADQVPIMHLQFRQGGDLHHYLDGYGTTYRIMRLFQDSSVPIVIELDETLASVSNVQALITATERHLG